MSTPDFEYAITKDVRNNPIVREVDQTRQRELWRSLAVGVFLVAVLLFSAWQHFELLRHGYEIERMQQERAREMEVHRHLTLEIETLQSPKRIEEIATQQLQMVSPTSEDAVVVQRIVPAPSPAQSVVAARQNGSGEGGDAAQ